MSTILYSHPDGNGLIEADPNALYAVNHLDATVTRVEIGPDGLRDLAARLIALADKIGGGAQ